MDILRAIRDYFYSFSAADLSTLLMVGCILASGILYIYRKKEAEAKYREHNKLNQ